MRAKGEQRGVRGGRFGALCTWINSQAPACRKLLKSTRLGMASPTATGMPASCSFLWPKTSSGCVGSSSQNGFMALEQGGVVHGKVMFARAQAALGSRQLCQPHLEFLPGGYGVADGPLLVDVQHDAHIRAENLARQQGAPNVTLRVGRPDLMRGGLKVTAPCERTASRALRAAGAAGCVLEPQQHKAQSYLELDGLKAAQHGRLGVGLELLVCKLQPAKRRVIAWVAGERWEKGSRVRKHGSIEQKTHGVSGAQGRLSRASHPAVSTSSRSARVAAACFSICSASLASSSSSTKEKSHTATI